jgi:hypothetical protein
MDTMNGESEIVNKLSALTKELHDTLQDVFFDSSAYLKKQKLEKKLGRGNFDSITKVYLGEHLKNARPINSAREYISLEKDFLKNPLKNIPSGSLFFLTNNDIGESLPKYIDLYNNNPDVLFVIWDWDSQHWVYMSSMLALHCDFYIPATSENAFLLSHFNPFVIGPVFVGAHQWTRRFLMDNIELFFEDRLNVPLGPHAFYGNFARRNRAISTVSKVYPSVNFGNHDYKVKSELDNLKEWAQHKTHWVAPVLGGVPIRVFNALITGGIPILPAFYKNLPEISILGNSPLYYDVSDLIEPEMINQAAVAKFDLGGESGLIQRISNAIENHHVDGHCERIFNAIENSIKKIKNNDRCHDFGYLGACNSRVA